MKTFVVVLAICSIASARPGFLQHGGGGGGGHQLSQLTGVPGISSFQKINYPSYNLLPLGEETKGSVPPATVVINTKHLVKVPEPYPVKVPYPVPHPVPVAKPYPVVQTQYIKVPHPVPVEIVKKVPYPVEVPKPFPVQVGGHDQQQEQHQQISGDHSALYGGSFSSLGGGDQSGHLNQLQQSGDQSGGYEQAGGYDQSGGYTSALSQQQQQWVPSESGAEGGYGVSEQTQEQEQH